MPNSLIPLPVARFRLEFEVETPLHLPAYAGSTLRGAWGGALRAASCISRQPSCDDCKLTSSCPYAVIFETRPPQDRTPSLQDFSQVPRPYVIEPPEMGERDYAPGEHIAFHIVLAGRALEHLALVIWAHIMAFRRGVGRGNGKAELLRVIHCGERETIVLDGPDGTILDYSPAVPPAPTLGETVTLHIHTPLRLQTNGRRATVEAHTSRKLLMALVRRVALVCEFHGAGKLDLDFSDLARRAESIESQQRLRWQDWTRYSSRQQKKIDLGGIVGEWRLAGDLAPFAPFLHLGQWLHVGKEATFGLGGYRMTDAQAARSAGYADKPGLRPTGAMYYIDPAAA